MVIIYIYTYILYIIYIVYIYIHTHTRIFKGLRPTAGQGPVEGKISKEDLRVKDHKLLLLLLLLWLWVAAAHQQGL